MGGDKDLEGVLVGFDGPATGAPSSWQACFWGCEWKRPLKC